METYYLKIENWYYPINNIVIHTSDDTVEIFQVGSTKLVHTFKGEQAKLLQGWLVNHAEELSLESPPPFVGGGSSPSLELERE